MQARDLSGQCPSTCSYWISFQKRPKSDHRMNLSSPTRLFHRMRTNSQVPLHSDMIACLHLSQIEAIEASGLCPQLQFINTTSQQDGPFRLKPDISIYSGTHSDSGPPAAHTESQKLLNWKAIDLWVENKNHDDDIFRDLEKMKEEDETDEDLESHIEWT
jgi:hypothetical protein